jgi:DNA-binding NtrC family response regulator
MQFDKSFMAATILIVDDDPVQRRLVEAAVTRFGYSAVTADGGIAALRAFDGPDGGTLQAVLLDLAMPDIDGIGVLKAMRERGISIPVIVQTAQGGIETVVLAMRHGAFDFLVKPASPDRIQAAIAAALKVEAFEGQARQTAKRAGNKSLSFNDLITASPAMERVIALGRKAAGSNIPILLEGESGVGKEVVARAIQAAGTRSAKPFVTVNCGAIPASLVESILFGHEKGSFTGASEKHAGKFVEADKGTLFLDEVGDLPLEAQVKLLRAVQEGEVDPVGGRSTVKVDIRLISATHRNLADAVADGKFREDLLYRLNVFPIVIPPLRDRREDIPLLVRHFMKQAVETGGQGGAKSISGDALALLQRYDWPGNIRQLQNAIFRACVLSDGDLLTEEEFPHIRAQVEGPVSLTEKITDDAVLPKVDVKKPVEASEPLAGSANFGLVRVTDQRGEVRKLADIELEAIRLAIERYNGHMSEVARKLGIGRSTLYRKLKEYGIDPEMRNDG